MLTHPQAAAQCRDWLAAKLPQALVTESGLTARAAADPPNPRLRFDAANLATPPARSLDSNLLAAEIADNPDAVTRSSSLTARVMSPPPTGADKTTKLQFMREKIIPAHCWRSWSSSRAEE